MVEIIINRKRSPHKTLIQKIFTQENKFKIFRIMIYAMILNVLSSDKLGLSSPIEKAI